MEDLQLLEGSTFLRLDLLGVRGNHRDTGVDRLANIFNRIEGGIHCLWGGRGEEPSERGVRNTLEAAPVNLNFLAEWGCLITNKGLVTYSTILMRVTRALEKDKTGLVAQARKGWDGEMGCELGTGLLQCTNSLVRIELKWCLNNQIIKNVE